jgi:hypothetical protein
MMVCCCFVSAHSPITFATFSGGSRTVISDTSSSRSSQVRQHEEDVWLGAENGNEMWQDLEIDAGCCGTKDKNVNGEDSD